VAGPCIAGELARRVDTTVVFCGRDSDAVARFEALLAGSYYRVWSETDVVGAEISAALKNAYAMAMAFGAGVHEARGGQAGSVALHNYEASVFAQAVHEMQLIVQAGGGSASTVVGLPGVGDLHVTCNGGRTGRFGRWLGLGVGRNEAISRMEGATLECLEILEVMREALPELEAKLGRGMLPLLEHMIDVALDDKPVAPPFSSFFRGQVGK
jgi:glycerol-3-phosphate dehydrogenase (NAD(P)+)